ncbi:high-affinity methionine permease [Lecanosticta acicola]|uniref:High-affinity methionine permease n=1 Tax=Lecanosticta acicola TaxID=111012 RepID=A0AAI8Z6F4_9PEZI|nr:high-affinity methionine permease [Lecanosticta acicola]
MDYAHSVASSVTHSELHGNEISVSSRSPRSYISPAASLDDDTEHPIPIEPNRRSLEDDVQPRDPAARVPAHRNLEWWDVAALIINKMVGTGIFTGPFATMYYTRSKALTMAFWVIGFLYTLLSMCLYLEYARDLPYTGGELVYLDHIFKNKLPRLLLYTWYTFYFVILYTTCTNSLQFARYTLIAADVHNLNPDRRLVCFVAFCITTFICLLLYFDSLTSRYVNASTALAKVVLLICTLAAGCWYLGDVGGHPNSWIETLEMSNPPKFGWTEGLLLVFFSFHGWENATFVAGEIPKYSVLRNGFIAAVVTVGVLYTAIVAVFCSTFPPDALQTEQAQDRFRNYLPLWLGDTARARQAAAILIALSAAGSMISVAYTCVRVKHIVGWVNILPLSNLWRRTDLSRHMRYLLPGFGQDSWQSSVNQAIAVRRGAPEGGLILHYIVSVILICITPAFDTLNGAIQSSGNVLIYGHFIYEAAVGLGYAFSIEPKRREEREIPANEWNAPEAFQWFTKNRRGLIALGSTTAAVSLFILAIELTQPLGRWYFVTIVAVTFLSMVYWANIVWLRKGSKTSRWLGLSFQPQIHGKDDYNNPWRQCSQCARLPGRTPHRHREDGYLNYNEVSFLGTKSGRLMEAVALWFTGHTASPMKEDLEHELDGEPCSDERVNGEVKEVLEKLFPYTYDQNGKKQQHFDIKSRTGGFLRIEAPTELSKADIAACYKRPTTTTRRSTGLAKYS